MEHSHKLLKQAIAAGLALGMAHGALANEDKITTWVCMLMIK